MHDPERGGSQIPLVICIILLLIAGFFAYSQYGDREAAEKDLNEILAAAGDSASPTKAKKGDAIAYITKAKGIYSQQKARLDEIKEVTGGGDEGNTELVVDPAKLKGTLTRFLETLDKGEFVMEIPVARYVEDPAGGYKVHEADGKVTVRYPGTSELRGARPDMSNVIEVVCIPAMRRMVADIKRYMNSYGQAQAAAAATDAKYRETLAAKDAEIRQKVDDYAAMEGRKATEINDLRRQKDETEAARAAAEAEKTATVGAVTAERNDWRKKAEQASAEVQVLKQKKRAVEADTSPDGKVLTADASQSLVVIDIGRANNNLMAGLNFEVYAIGKGGREIPKGSVKVTKVDASTASATVLELFDAYNPIAQGDLVRSLIYNPREATHVALVGRFSKMGKSDAARRLESLGVIVDGRVTTQTTYLVVGDPESDAQPIAETPEYKTAEMYGIPLLSEKELSRLTMY